MLLNHFRHGLFISFPFFLLSSMEVFVYAHLKNKRAPILHECLIILMMEHIKALLHAPIVNEKKNILSKVFGSSGSDTNIANQEEDDGCPSPMTTSLKKRKKGSLKINQETKHLVLSDSENIEVGSDDSSPRMWFWLLVRDKSKVEVMRRVCRKICWLWMPRISRGEHPNAFPN